MHKDVIEDVAVCWRPSAGPLGACLTFGVGHRDEDLHAMGLTHFVRELAAPGGGGGELKAAGGVSTLDCTYLVSGPEEEVASYLELICANLDALRTTEIQDFLDGNAFPDAGYRFSGLLTDDDVTDPFASSLAKRFGAQGIGLLRWPPANYASFTRQRVADWIDRYFNRANAVLCLTGPPPPGLRLVLPQGERATHAAPATKPLSGPRWYQDEVASPGLSMTAEPGAASHLLLDVLCTRVRKAIPPLKADWRLYPVALLAGPGDLQCALVSEIKGKDTVADGQAIARVLWEQLHVVAADGVPVEELDAVRASYVESAATVDVLQPEDLAAVQTSYVESAATVDILRPEDLAAVRISADVPALAAGELRQEARNHEAEPMEALEAGRYAAAESAEGLAVLGPLEWIRELGEFDVGTERELFGEAESLDLGEVAGLSAVTPVVARDTYARWLGTALVAVPYGAEAGLPPEREMGCLTESGRAHGVPPRKGLFKRRPEARLVVDAERISIVDDAREHPFALASLLTIADDRDRFLLADLEKGCAVDISDFGQAAQNAWRSVPPQLRRHIVD